MNISILLTIAFAGIFILSVVLGFVFGFLKGFKRGLLRFSIVIFSVVVAFFIAIPISNGLAVTQVFGNSVVGLIDSALAPIREVVAVPDSVQRAIEILPRMFVNVFSFVLAFFAVKIVSIILYFVLKGFIFSNERERMARGEKVKKGRLGGGIVGVLQGLVVAFVLFIPFAAYANAASTFTAQINRDAVEESSELRTVLNILDLVAHYENSIPGRFFAATRLDSIFFNSLSTVNLNREHQANLNNFAGLAGSAFNVLLMYETKLDTILHGEEEDAVQAVIELINLTDSIFDAVIDNALFRFIINEYIAFYDSEIQNLFSSLNGFGYAANVAFSHVRYGNFFENLRGHFDEITGFLKEIAEDGTILEIFRIINDESISNIRYVCEDTFAKFGRAVDILMDLSLVSVTHEYLSNAISILLHNQLYGRDVDDIFINLNYINFEGLFKTAYAIVQLNYQGYGTNENVDTLIVNVINSLRYQLGTYENEDPSNLIAFVDRVLIDIFLEGMDGVEVRGRTLAILENVERIGRLVYLMNSHNFYHYFRDFADTYNLSYENLEQIDYAYSVLYEIEALLNGAAGDFACIVRELVAGAFLGFTAFEGCPFNSLRRALSAYRLIIEAQNMAYMGESFDNVHSLINYLKDVNVITMLENHVGYYGLMGFPEIYLYDIEMELNARMSGANESDIELLNRLKTLFNL